HSRIVCGKCFFLRLLPIRTENGKALSHALLLNGFSKTSYRCGWGCNCTNSSGIRRPREFRATMADMRKAVVLLSGGMDSCVCAAVARQQHGAENVALLHASYGQRTASRESRAFREIADFYAIERRLMVQLDHFRAIGGSALMDASIA